MNELSPLAIPYDRELFPFISRNNSQYRKRFHISNYHEYKVNFIAGTEVPVQYALLTDHAYEKKLAKLLDFEKNILPHAAVPEVVKRLYQAKITEKRKLLQLVKSAGEAQMETHQGREAAHNFNQLTQAVFGAPSLNIFVQLMSTIQADFLLLESELQKTPAFTRFMPLTQVGANQTNIPDFIPTGTTHLGDQSSSFVSNAEEVVAFFKGKMMALQLHDWDIHISDKPIESFRVYGKKKLLLVPKTSVIKSRKNERRLSLDVMEGLFAHEVLTHVIRAVNGERSPLLLLAHGLAGYLQGEEGIATFREQQHTGAKDYSGKTMYLALGLAYGLDRNGQHRSFREVYEILCDYFTIIYGDLGKKVKAKAFVTCARIFVVSPHSDVPLIFTRDVVYREGNIAINVAVRENTELERLFDIGKFNPVNQEHIDMLSSLNII